MGGLQDDSVRDEILERLKSDCFKYAAEPKDMVKVLTKISSINEDPSGHIWHFNVTDKPEDIEERKAYIESELTGMSSYGLTSYVKARLTYLTSNQTKQTTLSRIRKIHKMMTDASLPSQQEIDRLYRYRTTLEKQFTSKLSQLIV